MVLERQEKELLFSRRIFAISEYELSGDKLKFFNAKGFLKKQRVLIKEIPVYEITSIESYWNELSVTWNGVTNLFFLKNSLDSFSPLRDQIQGMLDQRRKMVENQGKTDRRTADFRSMMNASMSVVDLSFDILMGLNEKMVDWERLEGYSAILEEGLNVTFYILSPLMADFSKISSAINNRTPKEISQEVYEVLKFIFGYFDTVKVVDNQREVHPNFEDIKAVIMAYYTLNDLLLGKVVGEKDNKEESLSLEVFLKRTADEKNCEGLFEELKEVMTKPIDEKDADIVVNARAIFREIIMTLFSSKAVK